LSIPSYTGETVHFGPPYTRAWIFRAVLKLCSATARHTSREMRSVRNATSSASASSRHCSAPYASPTAIRHTEIG
jgi:hypothetical protein